MILAGLGPEEWTAVGTVATAIVALFAAVFAGWQVWEMRRAREEAARTLREIQKSVKKWSDIHGRLKVWVRDEDRHRLDESIEHDLTGRHPTLGSGPPSELLMIAGRSAVVRAIFRTGRRVLDRQRAKSVS